MWKEGAEDRNRRRTTWRVKREKARRPGPRSLRYEGRGWRVGEVGQIAENELQRRSGGYISRGEAKPASQQGLDVLPSLPARRAPATVLLSIASRSFLRHYEAPPFALLVGEALFRETRTAFLFFHRCVFAASPFFTPLHLSTATQRGKLRPTTWNEMKFLRRKVPPGISSSLCPSSLFLSLFLATFLSALPSS